MADHYEVWAWYAWKRTPDLKMTIPVDQGLERACQWARVRCSASCETFVRDSGTSTYLFHAVWSRKFGVCERQIAEIAPGDTDAPTR